MEEINQIQLDQYRLLAPYFDKFAYFEKHGLSEKFKYENSLEHYITIGAKKNYNPSRFFDGKYYVENNNDIAEAGINPLAHYLRFGFNEGRLPKSNEVILDELGNIDISNADLNFKKWRLPCIIDKDEINSHQQIQCIIEDINETDAVAAVVKKDSTDWLIVFSGKNEQFFHLNKMRLFWGNILILRDTSATYYSENPNLPKIDLISNYIDYLTGPRTGRTIVIGQSFGGYAALYQSTFIKNSLTLGFSPQAFQPGKYLHNIYFSENIKKMAPAECAPDLISHLIQSPNAPRYVITGKSESSHEDEYYWGDTISAGIIAATGKCSVIIVDRKEHPTLQYLDAKKMFDLLNENYDLFINDSHAASNLLCLSGLYYPDK